jgi:hypothetical protein
MRRTTVLAVVALTVVALGNLSCATASPDSASRSETPGPTAKTTSEEPTSAGIPWLTDGQREEALQIMAADGRFRELLGNRGYSVAEIGPWHTNALKLVGAGIVIALDESKSFGQTDWPQADWDSEADWYSTSTLRFGAADVSTLHVLVDLNKRVVVEIRPDQYASIEPPPDFTPSMPRYPSTSE